jgi:hypothetical protein
MSEPEIPEGWHVEQPREFPYQATKFPWRIVNRKGDSISLVGDRLAELMASAPDLKLKLDAVEAKVAEQATTIAKQEDTIAVYRGQSRLVERITIELEEQAAIIERLTEALQKVRRQAEMAHMEDTPLWGIPFAALSKQEK